MSLRLPVLGALASGLIFGAGLVVSGMTNPAKVLGFLNVFGAWDASLMFVMMGAIGVHALLYRPIVGRKTPVAAAAFALPAVRRVDARLVIGSAIFGAGWGLSGYCPGPSVVALSSGSVSVLVFVAALLLGSFLASRWDAARSGADPQKEPVATDSTSGPKSLSALPP